MGTMIVVKLKDAYTGNSSIEDELTIIQGKFHDYLGISISCDTVWEVCITMYDYVSRSKLIAGLSEDMIGYKKTPAADYLIKTTDGGPFCCLKLRKIRFINQQQRLYSWVSNLDRICNYLLDSCILEWSILMRMIGKNYLRRWSTFNILVISTFDYVRRW